MWIGYSIGTDFSESQARQSELDWAHVAQSLMRPEIVAPVDVTAQLHLQLAQLREPPPGRRIPPSGSYWSTRPLRCRRGPLLGERAIYVVKTSSPCSVDGSEYGFGSKY